MKKLVNRKHYLLVLFFSTSIVFSQPVNIYAIPHSIEVSLDTTATNYNAILSSNTKTYGIITNDAANMHNSSSIASDIILKLSYGNFVEILSSDEKWCKVKYFCKIGYIPTFTVEKLGTIQKYLSHEEQLVGRVTADSLNIRNFPTTTLSDTIGSIKKGNYIEITSKVGNWYQINYLNKLAFVSSDYVNLIDGLNAGRVTDIDFSNTFTELVQTYTITHSSNSNRDHNLAVAAEIINGETSGYILNPGKQFNWFYVIGDTTPEKGFLEAGIIENKQSAVGYGGGCCEVASTINSAIVEAGITTHAYTHSVQPKYLVGHHEATVSFDSGINFYFNNSFDYPIKFEVTTNKGNVTVNVYKIPENN